MDLTPTKITNEEYYDPVFEEFGKITSIKTKTMENPVIL